VNAFTESTVEQAALAWLESLGYTITHGPDIAPGELAAERQDYGQVVLEDRLRQALAALNPDLPTEALDDAFRKLTRPEGPTPEARNRALHRHLVDGVTVEYRRADGSIAGGQVRVFDFAEPDANDWLAVNQFTVAEAKHTRRPDVVLFVNGLPLVLIELKNPADENATLWSAFNQLQTYQAELPYPVRLQRRSRRLRRRRGPHRHPHLGDGVVQAVADHLGGEACGPASGGDHAMTRRRPA
jgi:type I restriction enzyme R subunit